MLFEREWPTGNPSIGSDGLGPLFNARSCVGCHHQGGVGGGGDARFNAKTIGIEQMSIRGRGVDSDVVKQMVSLFHPGFARSSQTIVNTLPLAHHGGSPAFEQTRKNILAQIPAKFSEAGGPLDSEETRRSNNTPIFFEQKLGKYGIQLRARLFHRNTTSLFGSGLIDQVPEQLIKAQVKLQKQHPEISGRPSILKDGRYGKFGWRANVASLLEFNDQACANEVGLETARMKQPRDPMVPGYRNPAHDISDNQIRTMTAFVAALPAPVREIPSDSELRLEAERGEQVFAAVGCAVCHVPNMGPAVGVYSDLLLHDMGYESFDLNPAEPYRVGATPVRFVESQTINSLTTTDTNTTGYYGGSNSMTVPSSRTTGSPGSSLRGNSQSSGGRRTPSGFEFVAPTLPAKSKVIDMGAITKSIPPKESVKVEEVSTTFFNRRTGAIRGRRSGTQTTTKRTSGEQTIRTVIEVHYEPTKINQEWRTPPLWGVRDSAPYMHDGRAETLLEAISMHEGEGAGTRDRFLQLPLADRHAVLTFLDTMVAPPGVPQPNL